MRSYPRNSPEAAARIVALVLIVDGHVCHSEEEILRQLRVEQALGLTPGGFERVMHTLCEDLLMGTHGRGSLMSSVDDASLAALLAEVDDPALQTRVLSLASAAADADRHLADQEALVMGAARQRWYNAGGTPTARAAHSAHSAHSALSALSAHSAGSAAVPI